MSSKRRGTKGEAEYLRKCNFAESHTDALLRRLHRAFTFKGTPFDAALAARIAGEHAHETGLSFYEAVYELVMMAEFPSKGRAQVWGARIKCGPVQPSRARVEAVARLRHKGGARACGREGVGGAQNHPRDRAGRIG